MIADLAGDFIECRCFFRASKAVKFGSNDGDGDLFLIEELQHFQVTWLSAYFAIYQKENLGEFIFRITKIPKNQVFQLFAFRNAHFGVAIARQVGEQNFVIDQEEVDGFGDARACS